MPRGTNVGKWGWEVGLNRLIEQTIVRLDDEAAETHIMENRARTILEEFAAKVVAEECVAQRGKIKRMIDHIINERDVWNQEFNSVCANGEAAWQQYRELREKLNETGVRAHLAEEAGETYMRERDALQGILVELEEVNLRYMRERDEARAALEGVRRANSELGRDLVAVRAEARKHVDDYSILAGQLIEARMEAEALRNMMPPHEHEQICEALRGEIRDLKLEAETLREELARR